MVASVAVSQYTHAMRFNSLESLLVDAKILALQLRSSEPYLWALRELSGYSESQRLPFYRIYPCHCEGLFRCVSTGTYHVADINAALLDEKDNCSLRFYNARLPIMDYKSAMLQNEARWSGDKLKNYQYELKPGYVCEQAWQVLDNALVDHLMQGIRQMMSVFLLQACQKSGSCHRGQFDDRWNYSHAQAQPCALKHLELGHQVW